MNFIRFLFSKSFIKQVLYIGLTTGVLFFVLSFGLKIITKHNSYLEVPDLEGISLSALPSIMKEESLRFEVIDSSRFVPSLPPLSVISHLPEAGSEVKENRKIYLTVNPSGYRKVTVPNLIQITKRNAESLLKSTGFQLGEYSYVDNIGKDMVLEIRFQGNKIEPGTLLPKTSKIDLVLGNGKR
ncbi:PASTA domain-containing protein [Flavobacteriaceae bacterium]|nr:PASTA domain-containing protein [Flavobacteriaceae bacterium]